MSLLFSLYSIPTTYAQVLSNSQTKLTKTKVIPQQPPSHTLPGVRITSPVRGQQVTVGSNLAISGLSTSNTNSGCKVYIIVDSIKPYQRTIPIGAGGTRDYSTWKYQITPKYAAIKSGTNEITAKISCVASPTNITKFYSTNVTGVGAASIIPPTKGQSASSTRNATTTNSHSAGISSNSSLVNTGNNPKKSLLVSIHVGKKHIISGQKQTIKIAVIDPNSNKTIGGANIKGTVFYSSSGSITRQFNGTTDNLGKVSYSWKISGKDNLGNYRVEVRTSALGYEDKSVVTTFKVNSAAPAVITRNPNSNTTSILKLPFT